MLCFNVFVADLYRENICCQFDIAHEKTTWPSWEAKKYSEEITHLQIIL